MIEAIGVSECGPVRSLNEDSIHLDVEGGLFIVADGMGGLERGKEVSASAIRFFTDCCLAERVIDKVGMLNCLKKTNYELHSREFRGGTTFTAIHWKNEYCEFVHIGDSRLYHFNSKTGRLQQLTQDHSLAAQLERSGTSPHAVGQFRHILTRSLGTSGQIEPSNGSFKTQQGDHLLLCSDGLWQVIADDELAACLSRKVTLSDLAAAIRKRALSRNPSDNFSFVVVRS